MSDVLALELVPIQLPWLIDELDELRGPLEEELQRERAACAASREVSSPELDAREYELRLLCLMRARLPGDRVDEPVAFVGPSGMVENIVRGVMRDVAGALSELAGHRRPDTRAGVGGLGSGHGSWDWGRRGLAVRDLVTTSVVDRLGRDLLVSDRSWFSAFALELLSGSRRS